MNSNSSIPIVQGTLVSDKHSPYTANNPHGESLINEQNTIHSNSNSHQQSQQPKQFQDVIWAIAFIIHLGGMFVLISLNISSGGGDVSIDEFNGLFCLIGFTALIAVALSSLTISLMMKYPTEMIKMALIFSTILLLVMAISAFMMGSFLSGGLGLLFFAFTICYVKAVWSRIPFAAANLNTALTAVKSNIGLAFIAYFIMVLAFGWSCFFFVGFSNSLNSNNIGIMFLLLLSFYWVHQVLSNTVHVTTAGTVGTWWFVPGEANGCWSSAIKDSFCRATTYSFGSICFGSLVVAVVQALRALAHQARQNEDMQLLACLVECVLACIQDIIEYFNKWAYVYVGLYGFGYVHAGREVVQLFQNKGWTVMINDDLTDRVLMMVSIGVGVLTGFAGLTITLADQDILGNFGIENVPAAGFLVGFLVGVVFSSILMSVVGSAINTVIVCFAESPAEFEANHPQLSAEMRSSWVSAWPELSI